MGHLSTGGGVCLNYLAGRLLQYCQFEYSAENLSSKYLKQLLTIK